MLGVLKTVFCILSCLCLAAAIVIGAFFGWLYCILLLAVAALFAGLMFFVKASADRSEPPAPTPDFMNSDEENRRIREEQSRKHQDPDERK